MAINKKRTLRLDICDYRKNVVCNIYDSTRDLSGQATDVIVTTERNGWKELSFTLPSTCQEEDGQKDNYRIDYLIADYQIRVMDDYETDWFLISEPKVSHNQFSRNIDVTATHVCQLLKTKNLGLEFSDSEGNNVGTAEQLLTTILDGTGWYVGEVASFLEEDTSEPTVKKRSLECEAKTGAFRMIELMCEKFDAKPVYHGESYILLQEDPGDLSTNYSAYCKLSATGSSVKPIEPSVYFNGQYYTYVQLTAPATYERGIYYHYKVKSVDIMPMNPFSEDLEEGEIPNLVVSGDRKAIEVHYSKNLKDISRTLNTENIITKLYAYGSYGDLNGLCSIQTCTHNEYSFVNSRAYSANTEFRFSDEYGANYYFTIKNAWAANSAIVWSKLDFASRSYVWHSAQRKAYDVYKEPKTTTYVTLPLPTPESIKNYFPALFNFDYYEKIGLLDSEMKQKVAEYQRDMVSYYQASETAATNFANGLTELSKLADSQTGFLRLAIAPLNSTTSGYRVNADKSVTLFIDTSQGDNGVLYRSDYLESKRNYFEWHVAKQLKSNGEPVSGSPSALLIVHDTAPVTWERLYLKQIDDRVTADGDAADYDYGLNMGDEPQSITVWGSLNSEPLGSIPNFRSTDRFYLFCTVSTSGTLGALQYQDWAIQNTQITTATSVSTEVHPFYFVPDFYLIPRSGSSLYTPPVSTVAIYGQYGWYYRYFTDANAAGTLYFCGPKDIQWYKVYMDTEAPQRIGADYKYFFNTNLRTLHVLANGNWVEMESAAEQRIAACFSQVWYLCRRRDQLYNGIYEKYNYTVTDYPLVAGRYLIRSGYDYSWAFTTDQRINIGETLYVDTAYSYVYQDDDVSHIVQATTVPDYVMKPMPSNEFNTNTFERGTIDVSSGAAVDVASTVNKYRSTYIGIYPGYRYISNLPTSARVFFYDEAKNFISSVTGGSVNSFIVPEQTTEDYEANGYLPDARYLRISLQSTASNSLYLRLQDYATLVYISDNYRLPYTLLSGAVPSGELKGLNNLTKRFADLSDQVYNGYLATLQNAQTEITSQDNKLMNALGDILREGYWQNTDYVEGDEEKLYRDALDNLKEIAHPEASYTISYLDMYGANEGIGYSVNGEDYDWPDIQITDAIHLVDPEIDVNCWAYIDKITKCYDQPWKTNIEINTKLSLIGQHDFTDVMTRIAEVASNINSKQSLVARINEITSDDGYVYASKLVGEWEAQIKSTVSNWYTDRYGNIVFESADGMSAMMLTGSGFCIANKKDPATGDWVYNTIATGDGMAADNIITGYLNVERIENHSITSDKLSAFVGHDIDISSNKSLSLYATMDGLKPSGSLKTTDSIIEIAAGDGTNSAHINIETGGELNLTGATVNLSSNGAMNINSGGSLSIKTGGSFTVQSGKFSIDSSGNVTMEGSVTASGGSIGGWTIGKDSSGSYLYSGTGTSFVALNTRTSGTTSAYAIWAGAEAPTNAKFWVKKTGEIYSSDIAAVGGSISGWTISSTQLYSGNNTTRVGLSSATSSDVAIWAGSNTAASAPFRVQRNGEVYATDIHISNSSTTNSTVGGFDVEANCLLYQPSGQIAFALDGDPTSDYAIWAGHETGASAPFYVKKDGTLFCSNAKVSGEIQATKGFIGGSASAGGWTIEQYKLISGTGTSTVGLNSDPSSGATITFWAGASWDNINNAPFKLSRNGTLIATNASITGTVVTSNITATGGSIGGWTIGGAGTSASPYYLGNASTLASSTVGLVSSSTGTDVVIWAGGTRSAGKFRVTANGAVTMSDATITGGSILIRDDNSIKFKVDTNGSILATSGYIGNWAIENGVLKGQYTLDGYTSNVVIDPNPTSYLIRAYTESTSIFSVGVNGDVFCSNLEAEDTISTKTIILDDEFNTTGNKGKEYLRYMCLNDSEIDEVGQAIQSYFGMSSYAGVETNIYFGRFRNKFAIFGMDYWNSSNNYKSFICIPSNASAASGSMYNRIYIVKRKEDNNWQQAEIPLTWTDI